MEKIGRVVKLDENYVTVEYYRNSACASCHNKKACVESDSKAETVVLPKKEIPFELKENSNVILKVDLKISPYKVVFLMYALPLIFLLLAIAFFKYLGYGEGYQLLGGIFFMFLTFSGVKLYEKKLLKDKKIRIYIEKVL
jgi:positive regulator of sigma E activity